MEWEFDMDDFWHDHPGWEWSFMNKSHQCFSLIQDPRKVEYIQKLHSVQWDENCSLAKFLQALLHPLAHNLKASMQLLKMEYHIAQASTGRVPSGFMHGMAIIQCAIQQI